MNSPLANSVAIVGVTAPARPVRAVPAAQKPAGDGIRRWEAAETTRLNQAQFSRATGDPINTDLALDLPALWARCAHEVQQNPLVEGVIETHAQDIVGRDGPTLQVQSDDPAYNEAAEQVWRDFFKAPTPNPRFSGASLLKLWIRSLWKKGAYLAQVVTARNVDSPVSLRVQPIHSRRLATPPDQAANPNIFMGVECDPEFGVPVRYHVEKSRPLGQPLMGSMEYERIPADLMIHEFLVKEEDQARGYPWLAGGLQPTADVRELDHNVLDGAKQAALTGVYWFTNDVYGEPLIINETAEMERMTQRTGPPGYEPRMMTPQQPSQNYVEYRRERHAEIGRPVGMPLMLIRLDSSNHNYASARFDDQTYAGMVGGTQSWISGTPQSYGTLNWLCDQVLAEARFRVPALKNRPKKVIYLWGWPVRPHVDPSKERLGERIGMETGPLPFAEACRRNGTDEDAVFAQEKRTNEKREAEGLPPLPPPMTYLTKTGGDGSNNGSPGSADDDEKTPGQKKEVAANG